ncbi:MAG: family peptidase [Sphingomonas bacterium]|uniref:alpha/beta hydrolase family protein n=1 Tax=Sphingomonas bacterium TaxID=1895847 RepID=UPI0026360D2B|nr:prolyl oligopeptidase family serine peptidase [Sphingomonas bacterium]MDB5696670.1 family peptidase [Sphingomonas bacterium]
MSRFVRLAVIAAVPLLIASAPEPAAPKLDTAALADPGAFRQPLLSPDGQRLVARMFSNGQTGLAIAELGASGKLELIKLPTGQDLVGYRWAGDGRVLITLGGKVAWYGQGEKYITRMLVYDLASGAVKAVGPKVQGLRGDDVIWVDPAGQSLLMVSQPDQFHYPSVFRVNLGSGKATLEQGPYDNVWFWSADNQGNLRAGIGIQQYGWFVMYRRGGKGGFDKSPQVSWDADDNVGGWRLIFDSDDGYIVANRGGRDALYKYNFATRTLGEQVFASPTNDVSDYDYDTATGQLISASYTDDRDRIEWFEPKMKAMQATLDKTFGASRQAFVVSRNRDRSRMIVWAGSATDPGTYYLYEARSGALARLAKVADKVDRAGLSATRYVKYKARDGLEIPAYLTLPVGREAKALPLIVMPHGGPFGVRDKLHYDAEVQLLANRGYAVLQPNYRGSGGYGKEFDAKGEGQWGRAMQDDLDDGMDWAVAQGLADPKRVCLVGASYGGYAALWGATRNPERYRCAVSFAGVSDLKAQLDYSADFFLSKKSRRKFGNKVQGDKGFDLASVSPLMQVARLKVPVLVVHGDQDSTVPPKQTTQYDRALTAAGKPHETHIYADEGHGFDKAANQKDYMDRLEAFLTKYNPA